MAQVKRPADGGVEGHDAKVLRVEEENDSGFGVNVIEVDGKTCTHVVEWPEDVTGSLVGLQTLKQSCMHLFAANSALAVRQRTRWHWLQSLPCLMLVQELLAKLPCPAVLTARVLFAIESMPCNV